MAVAASAPDPSSSHKTKTRAKPAPPAAASTPAPAKVKKPSPLLNRPQNRYAPPAADGMTRDALAAWRKEERRRRNRESAAHSRDRARRRIAALEAEAARHREEYARLRGRLGALELRARQLAGPRPPSGGDDVPAPVFDTAARRPQSSLPQFEQIWPRAADVAENDTGGCGVATVADAVVSASSAEAGFGEWFGAVVATARPGGCDGMGSDPVDVSACVAGPLRDAAVPQSAGRDGDGNGYGEECYLDLLVDALGEFDPQSLDLAIAGP